MQPEGVNEIHRQYGTFMMIDIFVKPVTTSLYPSTPILCLCCSHGVDGFDCEQITEFIKKRLGHQYHLVKRDEDFLNQWGQRHLDAAKRFADAVPTDSPLARRTVDEVRTYYKQKQNTVADLCKRHT